MQIWSRPKWAGQTDWQVWESICPGLHLQYYWSSKITSARKWSLWLWRKATCFFFQGVPHVMEIFRLSISSIVISNISHPCPIHPTRVASSEALYDSNRFARSRSALPEVNIREITIQEPSSFLKRGNKLQSIRLRHVTIRLDSHAVDLQYRKSTSVK